MKAVVYTRYGTPEVLELKEIERPVPKDNEVLVKVHATTVTPMDWHLRQPGMNIIARMIAGPIKPKNPILGTEFAGEIESVGKDVKQFKAGDQVYGGAPPFGAHAEYVCMPENKVAIKPTNMTFREAAGVPFAGTTALNYLRQKGNIQEGHKVLVNGASGGVGTLAVQLAKYFGADVTGVCSTPNLEMVRSLGADNVIDYTKEDFTKTDQTYDIIFDAVGKRSFSQCKGSLNRGGIYLNTIATIPLLLQMLWTSKMGDKKAVFALIPFTTEDLIYLKDAIETGKVKTVIDRTYPLSEIAEAHRYSETGHAKGKIVITVNDET
ncbi:MAG: NAD(P)-dependent alcohol dehydrogenase [Dehalococcoidales bacterium]|nr:MAG: NAD(P)-dependent alcohol dehydrogenase [Dehalococcoidales bacterium]